MLIKST